MWPFSRKPVGDPDASGGQAGVALENTDESSELAPVKPYVNVLLMDMVKRNRLEATLTEVRELPPYHDARFEPPSFWSVSNRLKVMANLDPVFYVKPQDGVIDLLINGKPYTINVRFEDAGERRLHLRIVEGARAIPPRKPLV
ncbi:MAG: hypothetical protein NTW19_20770 [Planctomycetota bacterium]|nr:hypothetical protein [Planctomycetota bacterium]